MLHSHGGPRVAQHITESNLLLPHACAIYFCRDDGRSSAHSSERQSCAKSAGGPGSCTNPSARGLRQQKFVALSLAPESKRCVVFSLLLFPPASRPNSVKRARCCRWPLQFLKSNRTKMTKFVREHCRKLLTVWRDSEGCRDRSSLPRSCRRYRLHRRVFRRRRIQANR